MRCAEVGFGGLTRAARICERIADVTIEIAAVRVATREQFERTVEELHRVAQRIVHSLMLAVFRSLRGSEFRSARRSGDGAAASCRLGNQTLARSLRRSTTWAPCGNQSLKVAWLMSMGTILEVSPGWAGSLAAFFVL